MFAASRGMTSSAAAVPGTVTVCAARKVQVGSTKAVGSFLAQVRIRLSARTQPALARFAGPEQWTSRSRTSLRKRIFPVNTPFECRVNLGEHIAQTVLRSRGVVRDEPSNPANNFSSDSVSSVAVGGPQRVWNTAGGVGDDKRIPAVGFRPSGVKAGGSSHGRAWQISSVATAVTGHGNGQGYDGVGLDDDHEHVAMGLRRGENGTQRGFVQGQRLVISLFHWSWSAFMCSGRVCRCRVQ